MYSHGVIGHASLLETQTESLFHTYSQFANAPNIPAKPSDDETRTESQLQELLEKVRHIHST